MHSARVSTVHHQPSSAAHISSIGSRLGAANCIRMHSWLTKNLHLPTDLPPISTSGKPTNRQLTMCSCGHVQKKQHKNNTWLSTLCFSALHLNCLNRQPLTLRNVEMAEHFPFCNLNSGTFKSPDCADNENSPKRLLSTCFHRLRRCWVETEPVV